MAGALLGARADHIDLVAERAQRRRELHRVALDPALLGEVVRDDHADCASRLPVRSERGSGACCGEPLERTRAAIFSPARPSP